MTKRFPGVVANDHLNFDVAPGEIHALIGENGAGKSTLMNMLYGLLTPEEGTIFWKGQSIRIGSPRQALQLGIGMVHQHFMQVGALTVLENVVLGVRRGLIADWCAEEAKLCRLAAELELPIDPQARVDTLSVGERQRVEILKALHRDAELLILDEPTAALTPPEAEKLFALCRRLASAGKSVIFITHRLDEVEALSRRTTVLRQGRIVGTFLTAECSRRKLARLMVGRDLDEAPPRAPREVGPPLLEVTALEVLGLRLASTLRNISLTVCQGEIVGVAGVDGNGQKELVEALLGLRPVLRGAIRLKGHEVTEAALASRLAEGMACIPADRHAAAIVEDFSLVDNALLGHSESPSLSTRGWIDLGRVLRFTEEIVQDFQVKAASLDNPIRSLSGGHQQRFVLGRALASHPDLLIAAQPTRGLDIGSAEFVRGKLLELRAVGKAVLLISMDLDEVLKLSDRIEIIREGRIVGSILPPYDRSEIGLLMTGGVPTTNAT
ncbi:MAG: ABC transporter ATP-binding protein [Verrucomicrobiota bacterium]